MSGEVDAACVLDANHLAFVREGTWAQGGTKVIGQTERFDHCMMTAGPSISPDLAGQMNELLMSMSYGDSEVRPLLDLEGLKAWLPGRTSGYGPLTSAVDSLGFYDPEGNVIAADYRP
jgi:ABC-type phosphate/phosphonate transport system substrate-binding protein